MKLAINNEATAQVTGLESKAFGFEMNAKMYQIVIDKLYTNKPGAVIRELGCNAWDSHVMNGNTDRPFEIHMPSWLDKTFGIRDYGVGIPHDQFEDIYTNVGKSTKEDSNDMIGAYGLGSKTPFTLTDTFMVENYHDGQCSTWVCFKSRGTPEVSRVGICPSDEESGLKVSFAFTDDAVAGFERELTEQLKFFPVKPIITGGDKTQYKWPTLPAHKGKSYFYMDHDPNASHYGARASVLMGNVNYSFDPTAMGIGRYDELYNVFSAKPLVIKATLGDVDIVPSRESLELTDKTKAFIKQAAEHIRVDYSKQVKADFLLCETKLEAQQYAHSLNSSLLPRQWIHNTIFCKNQNYTWDELRKNRYAIRGYTVQNYIRHRVNPFNACDGIYLSHITNENYVMYVNDLGKGGVSWLKNNHSSLATERNVYMIKPQGSLNIKTLDADVVTCIKYMEDLGFTICRASDIIGKPVTAAKGTVAKVEPDQIFTLDTSYSFPDSLKHFMKPYTSTDYPTKGYYLEISGWNSISGDHTKAEIMKQLPKIHELLDEPLYFVRSKSVKKLPKTLKTYDTMVGALAKQIKNKAIHRAYLDKLRLRTEQVSGYALDIITKDTRLKAYLRYSGYVATALAKDSREYNVIYRSLTGVDIKQTEVPSIPRKLQALSEYYRDTYKTVLEALLQYAYSSDDKARRVKALNNLLKNNCINK